MIVITVKLILVELDWDVWCSFTKADWKRKEGWKGKDGNNEMIMKHNNNSPIFRQNCLYQGQHLSSFACSYSLPSVLRRRVKDKFLCTSVCLFRLFCCHWYSQFSWNIRLLLLSFIAISVYLVRLAKLSSLLQMLYIFKTQFS